MIKWNPPHLKLLISHEVQGFFDFGNGAGSFPAEVCCRSSIKIVGAFL